jgi:hypothetical protein
MSALGPFPFLNLPVPFGKTEEKPKIVPVVCDFSQQESYSVDLSLLQSRDFIKSIQGVFADNSLNTSDTTSITVTSSNQELIIPSKSQGTFPLFVPGQAQFTITSSGNVLVKLFFTNFMLMPMVWTAA